MRSFVVTKQSFALLSVAALMSIAAVAQQSQQPASAPAPAANAQRPNKVGVIQIQRALVGTKEGQKAMQDFQARVFEPKKKELDRKAGEIRDLQDKLQRGGAAMAQTAKEELQRSIDAKTKLYNRDMQDAQDEAEQEQRKILDELGQKMMQVIDKYAQENGYAVIIDVSNPQTPVLYASNTVDITKDIIELYDKMAPSLPATPPATSTPKPAPTKPATPAVKKQP
jgi:outer membrane protein